MDLLTLKICFLAGTLGQGGAERQLLYTVRALKALGANVRIYCPYRGEYYESKLLAEDVPVIWLGPSSNDALRFLRLARHLLRWRPHVIQAAHFHMNLPANLLGRALGALYIATSRSDIAREIRTCKPWGNYGVRTAAILVANSAASRQTALELGIRPEKVIVLPNVIDLREFDHMSSSNGLGLRGAGPIWAAAVGTLSENKRFDHFLRALAQARQEVPQLQGFLAGDGSGRERLQKLALSLSLGEGRFHFLGRRDDVPALLKHAGLFVLCSQFEGCPNVLLEAMAAGLPIVTTPAGDASDLVNGAEAGFVVPHDDLPAMTARLVQLAKSPELRSRLGANGRRFVEKHHDVADLGARLVRFYQVAARHASFSRSPVFKCLGKA